jgi:hypothetical protein
MSATALPIEIEPDERDSCGVPQVLDAVSEFGAASLGLVAWEYDLPESAVAHAWAAAISQQLIQGVGVCPETGEALFALSD